MLIESTPSWYSMQQFKLFTCIASHWAIWKILLHFHVHWPATTPYEGFTFTSSLLTDLPSPHMRDSASPPACSLACLPPWMRNSASLQLVYWPATTPYEGFTFNSNLFIDLPPPHMRDSASPPACSLTLPPPHIYEGFCFTSGLFNVLHIYEGFCFTSDLFNALAPIMQIVHWGQAHHTVGQAGGPLKGEKYVWLSTAGLPPSYNIHIQQQ